MADPTLAELQTLQEGLEQILGDLKLLLDIGNSLDARSFAEFMREFRAFGEALDSKIAADIRRELDRRRRAQERMLPLIVAAVDVDARIASLKEEIAQETNEDRKKRLHKQKIKRLIVLIIVNLFVLLFVKKSIDEAERLKRKLAI